MATKLQIITDAYQTHLSHLNDTPSSWTAFLRCACRNYKCAFDEQVLIYAQRPDATAVLEFERWNRQFGRWVNKGAKGIAVFDRNYAGNTRLKHYFDVSDTNSRYDRPVYIWQIVPEYEAEVIETLQNNFGTLDNTDNLADAIILAAKNMVDDNLSDYVDQMMTVCHEKVTILLSLSFPVKNRNYPVCSEKTIILPKFYRNKNVDFTLMFYNTIRKGCECNFSNAHII